MYILEGFWKDKIGQGLLVTWDAQTCEKRNKEDVVSCAKI